MRAEALRARLESVASGILNTVYDSRHRTPMLQGGFRLGHILQLILLGDAIGIALDEFAGSASYAAERRVLVPPPRNWSGSPRYLKRMSVLERATGMDLVEFRRIWIERHGPRVASHAGPLAGYCQNIITAAQDGAPDCDGITELWFRSEAEMNLVLPSSGPSDLTKHASEFIGGISTFLVREEKLF